MLSQSNKGTQGPHLERLNEHLKRLQNDLQTCTASRHHVLAGRGAQVQPGCWSLPSTARLLHLHQLSGDITHELQTNSTTLAAAAHIFEHILAIVCFHMYEISLWCEATDVCRKGMALRRLAQPLPEGAAWRMCSQSSRSSTGTLLLREQAGRPQRPGRLSL